MAIVQENDLIRIDIPGKTIELMVSETEIKKRLAQWVKPEPKIKKGYMARYARQVSSAGQGAIFHS
jgi:dihydroxy-acid dehydratase